MRSIVTGFVCAVALVSVTVDAQNSAKDAVLAADKAWADAYLACNVSAWQNLLADDLTFIHLGGNLDDKAAQIAAVKMCNMQTLTTEVNNVRLYGDDTAIVMGRLKASIKGRPEFKVDLVYTRTYVKQGGAWKLAAHQSTAAPAPKPGS